VKREELEIEGHKAFEIGKIVAAHALEAVVNGAAEVFEASVVAVGQAFLFGEFSEPFDQVQIRAVGRQIQQFDVLERRVGGDLLAALVAGVVEDQRDGRSR